MTRTSLKRTTALLASALVVTFPMAAQFGRGGDWVTAGFDPNRSGWVRSDPKISVAGLQKPGAFTFLWKMKFDNQPRQMNLTTPILMERIIGYRGFRALAFVGGSSNKIFVVDSDLARSEWDVQLPGGPAHQATPNCPGGLTSAVARPGSASFPPNPTAGGGGPGRGTPAQSAVGEPGEGAVTLARLAARRNAAAPTPQRVKPQMPAQSPRAGGRPIGTGPGGFGRGISPVYAISASGALHMLNVQNGAEAYKPVPFVPANSNASGLVIVDNLAYAVTDGDCGSAPAAVWAMDLDTDQVTSWQAQGGVAGSAGVAVGGDGTVFVATRRGELAALEPRSLKHKASYRAEGQEFTTSPVAFPFGERTFVAAATAGGQLHVVDAAGMAAVATTTFPSSKDFKPGALATWQDLGGTRWLLVPSPKAVVAFKLIDRNGAPALEPGWTSREMATPVTPIIMNGVVFAASSGSLRSDPAVLYALDGASGKELWNSGRTITSFVHGAGLSGGASQVYLATYDGTLYAFGFPIEH